MPDIRPGTTRERPSIVTVVGEQDLWPGIPEPVCTENLIALRGCHLKGWCRIDILRTAASSGWHTGEHQRQGNKAARIHLVFCLVKVLDQVAVITTVAEYKHPARTPGAVCTNKNK